ncbi:AGAP001118-PA-like protein [Anopheles sinensis]|uniref:AGAP001118-PA-like protein n=1 Tax=Anopheles sinensis TaxID=74873 RepID=A0A084WQP5_ANOSI|nr:AGAP001118-PA-like protein [Anopheles sinensis]
MRRPRDPALPWGLGNKDTVRRKPSPSRTGRSHPVTLGVALCLATCLLQLIQPSTAVNMLSINRFVLR